MYKKNSNNYLLYLKLAFLFGASFFPILTFGNPRGVCWHYACYLSEMVSACGTCYSEPKAACDAQYTSDKWYMPDFVGRRDPNNDTFLPIHSTRGYYGPVYRCGVTNTGDFPAGSKVYSGGMYRQFYTCSDDTPYLDPETMRCVGKDSPQLAQNGEGNCSAPSTTPAAGNPIRIATGNKFQQETLFSHPFPFELSYNSSNGQWVHGFHYHLRDIPKSVEYKQYTRPDGQSLAFYNNEPLAGGSITLSSTEAFSAKSVVNYYGQKEYYDDQGRILRIEKPQGTVQTFTWNDQQLVVQDQQSNRLTLTFDDKKRLISAVQPNGKPTTLEWSDDDKLLKVTQFDGSIRQYHYENSTFPKHLTGITDGNGNRFASWTYDSHGRAISSEHAGGTEKTSLEYHDNNSTTVTNPLGKKTTYYFQVIDGVNKVIKVEGQQTEHCAAANKEYTYYDNGLLKSKTDWKGMVTAFEYNDRGLETKRTVAVGTPSQYEVVTEWHDTLRLPTAKITRGEREVYRYDEQGRLINKGDASE